VQQPFQAARPVRMAVRFAMTVAIRVTVTVAVGVLVEVPVAVLVLVPVAVLMPVLVTVPVLVVMPVPVAVIRAGHFIHASILREQMRFRTSTTTSCAHVRKECNNPVIPASNPP
jgi:hypothetical protein